MTGVLHTAGLRTVEIILKKSPSLFTYHTHNDFDSADPSSVQDTCHVRTQLNDLALHEFL